MDRRTFVGGVVAVTAARVLQSQSFAGAPFPWGSPVVDSHFHPRPSIEANLAHLNGSDCQAAYLLSRLQNAEDVKRFIAREPARFGGYSVSTDVTASEAVQLLTAAVKNGAHGIGEVKYHVAADGPEMRKLYAAAAELGVPITLHFQEVPHTPAEGVFNTGFNRFDKILKEFPKTTFVGHCDAFWANVSRDYHNDSDYPRTPIAVGGMTDKWLPTTPIFMGTYQPTPVITS